jgi:outer membrane usher protein
VKRPREGQARFPPASRKAFLLQRLACATVVGAACGAALAQPAPTALAARPLSMLTDGPVFRLRLAWPRGAEDMPMVRMAPGSLRLVLRVPVGALGPDHSVPALPPGPGPVRSVTVQVTGSEALIVLELHQPTPYELRQSGAAWILELDATHSIAAAASAPPPAAPAPSLASAPVPAPAAPPLRAAPPAVVPPRPLARPAIARAETLLLDVTVNGRRLPDVVQAERSADGRLTLPAEAWTEARLQPAAGPAGQLDSVPGLVYTLDRQRLTLEVTAPPAAFLAHAAEGRDPLAAPPPRPQPGVLLNYDVTASAQTQGRATSGALAEGIFFSELGSFVGSAVVSDTGGHRRVRRLDTFWQLDLPDRMESVVGGDAVGTAGAWSRPVRYGGVRWGRDFGLRPGFVTLPQPTFAGSAALPSTVDVLIDNQQRLSRPVPPGPFTLTGVPLVSGAGDVNLVVRDLLGRETVVQQSFYQSPRLLAEGLDDYSVEAGLLRTGYGTDTDRYGDPFATATWRRGLTPGITGEVRLEAERDRRAAGVEVAGLIATLAVGRASLAWSGGDGQSGTRTLLGVERSSAAGGGSVQWERYSEGFTPLAHVPGETRPRQRLLASAGGRLLGSLSGGVSYARQTHWNAAPASIVAVSLGVPLPQQFSLSVFYSRELTGAGGWRGGLTLTRPLGEGVYATAVANRAADGSSSAEIQATGTTPTGPGVGWRVAAGTAESRAASGGVSVNTSSSELTADVESDRHGVAAARVGMRGSIGRLEGMGFASRPIGRGAFAVVRVADQADVPVLRSHQVVALTNAQGLAFVPGLQPYQANIIEIDPTGMSLDAELAATRIEVTPYARSGAVADFQVRTSRGALVQLVQADGAAVPVGAQARVVATGETFTVAGRGEAYLTGLQATNRIEVSWAGHRCALDIPLPSSGELLPRIGPLLCKERRE